MYPVLSEGHLALYLHRQKSEPFTLRSQRVNAQSFRDADAFSAFVQFQRLKRQTCKREISFLMNNGEGGERGGEGREEERAREDVSEAIPMPSF